MEVMIYVLDSKLPCDILLRRSWINPMRCVPFTLHRFLKFNHEAKECVVKSAEENPNLVRSIRNILITYRYIEIHEYEDED